MSVYQTFVAWCENDSKGEYAPYAVNPDGRFIYCKANDAYAGWRGANARTVKILGELKVKLAGKPEAAKMIAVLSALQELHS